MCDKVGAKAEEAHRLAQDKGEEVAYLRGELIRMQEEEELKDLVSPLRRRKLRPSRSEPDGLESVHRKVMGSSSYDHPPEVVRTAGMSGRRRKGTQKHDEGRGAEATTTSAAAAASDSSFEDSVRFYQELEQSIQQLQSKILSTVGDDE